MKTTRLLGAVLVGGLLLAACGDDGGGAESNEYSEAIAESLRDEEDNPFTDEQIDCLSAEFVDALGGPSTFEDADITPEDLAESEELSELGLEPTDEQIDDLAGSFSDCDVSITELFLTAMGDEAPEEARECLEENLDDEELARLFAESIAAGGDIGDEMPEDLLTTLMECLGSGS